MRPPSTGSPCTPDRGTARLRILSGQLRKRPVTAYQLPKQRSALTIDTFRAPYAEESFTAALPGSSPPAASLGISLLPLQGSRHWASTPPVSRRSRQSATGPSWHYPGRTSTGKRRRAYEQQGSAATSRLHLRSAGRTTDRHCRWVLPLGAGEITQLAIDYSFTLVVDSWIKIRINCPFSVTRQGQERTPMTPRRQWNWGRSSICTRP
jgi:hypothetical protein